jgi:hypothetical protein
VCDGFIRVIPTDPVFLPTAGAGEAAMAFLRSFCVSATSVEAVDEGQVVFVDAGDNFDGVRCPACRGDLDNHWWAEAVDRSHDETGFEDLTVSCPKDGHDDSVPDVARHASLRGGSRRLVDTKPTDRRFASDSSSGERGHTVPH